MKPPMLDIIEIESQYYVRAKSSLADTCTNVLMAGDIFAVFDRQGNFRTTGSTQQGLFYKESRHLSRWVLRLAQDYFLLLSSNVRADNALLSVDLTNPEMRLGEQGTLRPSVLHVCRSLFVWQTAAMSGSKSEITVWTLSRLKSFWNSGPTSPISSKCGDIRGKNAANFWTRASRDRQ